MTIDDTGACCFAVASLTRMTGKPLEKRKRKDKRKQRKAKQRMKRSQIPLGHSLSLPLDSSPRVFYAFGHGVAEFLYM